MLDFVPDVRSCQIIIKAFRIIVDDDFLLYFAFVLSLYKLLVQLINCEGLNKRVEFLLLVISC